MKKTLYWLGGIIIFLTLWQLLALFFGWSIILPSPREVLPTMVHLLLQPDTGIALAQTAWKVLLSLTMVLLIGIVLGLLLGLVNPLYEMMRPIIMVIQAVPVISWLTLVIFAWGIGWRGPVFITFLALLPMALLTTVSGVRNLDQKLLEMARVYKVSGTSILKDIYIGSLLPFVAAIIDVSIGQAWKVILVTEYLCGNSGLGVKILSARYAVDSNGVYAYTLLAVILGIITERLVKLILGEVAARWRSA